MNYKLVVNKKSVGSKDGTVVSALAFNQHVARVRFPTRRQL